MATYAITTTDEQEAAITAARLKANETQVPPFVDNADFVTSHANNGILAPLVAQFIESRLQAVADAYRVAASTDRANVDAVLKVSR